MRLKKTILAITIFLILIGVIYSIGSAKFGWLNKRKVFIQDHRFDYTATYEISSKADLKIVDTVIDHMTLSEDTESDRTLKTGGFILIEETINEVFVCYRVKGTEITKYVYEKDTDKLIETIYLDLDDKYYQMVADLCVKYRKKCYNRHTATCILHTASLENYETQILKRKYLRSYKYFRFSFKLHESTFYRYNKS